MELFPETLDPSESKEYTFDWTPKLGDGETIVSHVVTFIDTAGTSAPSNGVVSPFSKVRLAGGTHGGRVTFSIVATTSAGNVLDVALAVDVIDNAVGQPVESDVQRLTRLLAEAEAQRHNVALGTAVIDIWRDGRRIRKHITNLAELNSYMNQLRRELASATAVEGGSARRRAIGVRWSN